jgi:HD-like signal output (HDOD) protein
LTVRIRFSETDQAIAAKVLKLANSSYYGLSGKVASIQHASVVLGHRTLGELITRLLNNLQPNCFFYIKNSFGKFLP